MTSDNEAFHYAYRMTFFIKFMYFCYSSAFSHMITEGNFIYNAKYQNLLMRRESKTEGELEQKVLGVWRGRVTESLRESLM